MRITPNNLTGIATAPRGSLILDAPRGFTEDQANQIRWRLAQRDLRESMRLDGQVISVDAAIDHLVAYLLCGGPGFRIRRPHAEPQATWDRVRAIFDSYRGDNEEGEFYLDGEELPLCQSAMFDMFEEYIFADEY